MSPIDTITDVIAVKEDIDKRLIGLWAILGKCFEPEKDCEIIENMITQNDPIAFEILRSLINTGFGYQSIFKVINRTTDTKTLEGTMAAIASMMKNTDSAEKTLVCAPGSNYVVVIAAITTNDSKVAGINIWDLRIPKQ